jgi:2-polyprenyl-3-methyl-5-hydroxy-6-metoxy-1,4-benzoquinol methylase
MKSFSVGPRRERFRSIPCPLCGSGRSARRFEGRGYRFVTCLGCGLVYQNPQPLPAELPGRYGRSYFEYERRNEGNFFRLMELGLRDIGFPRLAESLHRPRRALDVGCATGMLLESLRSGGWEVQGLDLCRQSARYAQAKRGVPVFVGTLEQACFPDSSFTLVHFSHLIEHLPDPAGFLREVHRILRPEGYAVVTTPNIDGLQARLFRERWRSAIADHLCLFSRKTLGRLLSDSGFRVLKIQTWGGLAAGTAPAWLKRPADVLAKRLGFGDVVLMLVRKQTG